MEESPERLSIKGECVSYENSAVAPHIFNAILALVGAMFVCYACAHLVSVVLRGADSYSRFKTKVGAMQDEMDRLRMPEELQTRIGQCVVSRERRRQGTASPRIEATSLTDPHRGSTPVAGITSSCGIATCTAERPLSSATRRCPTSFGRTPHSTLDARISSCTMWTSFLRARTTTTSLPRWHAGFTSTRRWRESTLCRRAPWAAKCTPCKQQCRADEP